MVNRSKIFISHSSKDKEFVRDLAWKLKNLSLDVWYDEWAISIGDSIIDKIFEGLEDSDILIIVLSKNSVSSSWVKEELASANMRRISQRNIRILPILIDDCEIPISLMHIKYADFRDRDEKSLVELIEVISPCQNLWQSLNQHYDHFCLLIDSLLKMNLGDDAREIILKIHSLLEVALNLRTEIEIRQTKVQIEQLNFFEKIGLLADKGIDVRSQTWNKLVHFRAYLAHDMRAHEMGLRMFAEMLNERYEKENLLESIKSAGERLIDLMKLICF